MKVSPVTHRHNLQPVQASVGWFVVLTSCVACFASDTVREQSSNSSIEINSPAEGTTESQESAARPFSIPQAKLVLIDDVLIASRDAGIVTEVNFREGDSVGLDDVVVELDRELFQAELESARRQRLIDQKESENDVDVRYAEKSSLVNQRVLERSTEAIAAYEKSVSKTELERLELELQRSRLSKQQAIHAQQIKRLTCQLRLSQEQAAAIRLSNRTIKAPLSGQLVEVLVQPGQHVAAGQPIARIIRLDRLEVEAYVDSQNIFDIHPGQAATFEVRLGDQTGTAAGQVVFVSPEIDPLNGDFKVSVEIDNDKLNLRPGMVGELLIGG